MKISRGACTACAVALIVSACGQKTPPPKPLPAPPSIIQFTADKARVSPGDAVTLSFTAENATEAVVLDQKGAKVEFTGDASSGTAVVHPTETSFYVLKVSGEGGRASAFAQVAVDEDLREVFLVAVPPQIDSGEEVQLLWSAFHARSATISSSTGEQIPFDFSTGSGVIAVKPARTVTYQLVASGADASKQYAQAADVKVRPVLADFAVNPAAARQGKPLTISWETRGASEVTLSEATFGELKKVSIPADEMAVDKGSFEWTVPTTLPNQQPVLDGHPLKFTLTVKQTNPEVTLTKSISSFVGDGPRIVVFDVPNAVTDQNSFTLGWSTLNATRLQVLANGGVIYEPLPRDAAKVQKGSLTLKAPKTDTTYEVIAYGQEGTTARASKLVRVVPKPAVTSFNLPAAVMAPGSAAKATWTTTGATSVALRIKDGPILYTTHDAAKVANGTGDVFPGIRTTFVLEAYNDAGDKAVSEPKTVDVSMPGALTATPAPVTPGEVVIVTWSFDPTTTAGVVGDPTVDPIQNPPGTDWVELDDYPATRTLNFTNGDDAVAKISLEDAFVFPFLGQSASTFYVSTNGFITFADAGALPSNVKLDDPAATAPTMIAPFWDNLVLGANGRVLYLLDGTTFPRRLIVQWDKVQTASDNQSELTFEVQLYETGEMHFAYKTLTGTDSGAENASVGYRLNGSLAKEMAQPGTATRTSGDEFVFFGAGNVQGQYQVKPDSTSLFVLFQRVGTKLVAYPAKANVIAPGSVIINEAMVSPDTSATAGKWIELHNTTDKAVDISGAQLVSTAAMGQFTIEDDTVIPAGGYLVFGESTDPLQNGGAPVDKEWSGFTLDPAQDDTISLLASQPVSTLSYTAAEIVPGTSIQPSGPAIDASGNLIKCTTRKVTFGSNGAYGTPGAKNESCFEYELSSIPVAFEDISTTGTALFSGSIDDQRTQVTLADAVPYFGTPSTNLGVSANGFVSFSTLTSSGLSNKAKPSSAQPTGTIAVFWDDLGSNSGFPDSNVYVQQFPASGSSPGRTIVQWNHMSHLNQGDDLKFQVKLFTDGTIEFHYGTLVSGSASNYANGNSATLWIERPAGDAALPISINTAGTFANRAWRFTPVP